mgnify:CR=1 FL=1
MTEFIHNVVSFQFAISFGLFLLLVGATEQGYQNRATNFSWILWFIGAVLLFVVSMKTELSIEKLLLF